MTKLDTEFSAEDTPSTSYAIYVLTALTLLYLVNVADRYVATGLLEPIKQTFDISDTYMAFLAGPAFAIVYTFLAIPIALFADRINRVRIIAAGAIIWSGFTIASGLAQTPATFALARLGVGVGEAAFFAPALSLLADYFPPKRRALAFAILNFGVYFGQITGQVGGAAIAEASHWRNAFLVLGIPGIVLGLLALLTIKEPERGRLDPPRATAKKNHSILEAFEATARSLFARPSYRNLAIGTAFGGFASYGFGMWGPTYFVRVFDLALDVANARYGLPSVAAGLIGVVAMGILCDRLAKSDSRWPLRLSAIGLLGFMVSMLLLCMTDNVNIATALTIPAGLMAGGWVVAIQASLQDLMPAHMRATGSAFWGFALTFTGIALGFQFAGFMSDVFAGTYGATSIRPALMLTLLPAAFAAFFILRAGRTIDDDRKILAGE